MNVSLYQAAAALDANSQWQDVIADNLASSSVPGYRQQQLSLSAVAAGLMPATNAKNLPQTFTLPSPTTVTNFNPGELKYTGNNTDVAIEGKGFFAVQLPNGDVGLTRDGEFQVNPTGAIVTKESYPVLGMKGPLQLNQQNTFPVSISATGVLSQGAEQRDQIRMVEAAKQKSLTQISGGYFTTAAANLQPSTASTLRQGYLEGANTSAVNEMASMMTAMRGYEANQHVIQIQDDRLNKVITTLGNPS